MNDPQLFDDQLEVWNLIIQKSTVIPSSPMVLFLLLCYRPPSFEKKGVYLPYLAHNSQNSIKEGVVNLATIGQNDSGPMKMKLKNWILLAFCFTEHNKSYAQTSHEASLPQIGYDDRTLSERTINR